MHPRRLEILDHLPQPAFAVAAGPDGLEFVHANRGYLTLIGWPEGQEFGGPIASVLPDETVAAYATHIERSAGEAIAVAFETDGAGGGRSLLVECSPLSDGTFPPVVLGLARDVSEQKRVEAALAFHTRHDPDTQLPNRAMLVEMLGEALPQTTGAAQLGLVVAGLAGPAVDDRLGHDVRDELFTVAARRVERVLRAGDTIARFGRDELAIVCSDVDDVADVLAVAERIRHVFDDPFAFYGGEAFLAAAIGIAMANGAGDRPERLLRDAEAAVTYAKSSGRGGIEVFDDRMRSRADERRDIDRGLRGALSRGELRVHYQPLVRFDQSHVIGFEALVRWQHPKRGLLAPDAFLDVADASGLVVPIGAWVLREACGQAARWATESMHDEPLAVAVNVAGRQLVPDFVHTVEDALARSGLAPESLVLEVTERALANDPEHVRAVLHGLRGLGVQLALDDFGTGQTSLGYLKELPITSLKIDRSFIERLGESEIDAAIVAAVVGLGHALGLTVTAEGVETPRQLSELRSLGCDIGQGYYFARPQPGEIVRALVHRRFQWKQPA